MSRIKKISGEISTLTLSALADLQTLLARYDLTSLLRENPVIELYDSHEELSRERQFHDMRRALGFRIDEISGDEAKQMEPSISSSFACATVFHDWRSVIDARRFVVDLHAAFIARGGVVECDSVTAFIPDGLKVTGVRTKSGTIISGDQYVLAAGIWSRQLARDLGLPIQMEGVIGYQASLKSPGIEVNHALIYAKGGFGITPYESGLAVAGSIEFAHLEAKPNWKRADALLNRAQRVLPGLQTQSVEKRIGRRPLTPDTKPIIGRTPSAKNVILATGHGQLGLTLCATTGKLVSDIVANRTSNIDLAPFRPDRF